MRPSPIPLLAFLLLSHCGSLHAEESLAPLKDKTTVLRTAWPQMLAMSSYEGLRKEIKDFSDDQKWTLFQLALTERFEVSGKDVPIKPTHDAEKFPTISEEGWKSIRSWFQQLDSNEVGENTITFWDHLVQTAKLEKETKNFNLAEKRLFLTWMNQIKFGYVAYPSIDRAKLNQAHEWVRSPPLEDWQDRYMVVLASSVDYEKAKEAAERGSKKLGLTLDLRNLEPHPKTGLTHPKKFCAVPGGFGYPCYYARPDAQAETVGVEHSTSILGLTPGYYIAVAASGPANDDRLQKVLEKARVEFPDAYVKQFKIYTACGH